jgi:hypothetical protein
LNIEARSSSTRALSCGKVTCFRHTASTPKKARCGAEAHLGTTAATWLNDREFGHLNDAY